MKYDWALAEAMGDVCREVRLTLGLSQRALAVESGSSLASVSQYEKTGGPVVYLEALSGLVAARIENAAGKAELLMALDWAKEHRRQKRLQAGTGDPALRGAETPTGMIGARRE